MQNRDIQRLGQGKSALVINRSSPSKGQRRMERTNAQGKLPAVGESSGVVKMERELERAKEEEERLPDDLTRKIIKRLPVRSAARLQSVAKDDFTAQLCSIPRCSSFSLYKHGSRIFIFRAVPVVSMIGTLNWCPMPLLTFVNHWEFINLPSCPISGETAFFFGFDPIGAHYKVLANLYGRTPAPTNLPYSPEFVCYGPDKIGIYSEEMVQTFVILRGWGSLVPDNLDEQYHCMGTVSTGELIFAPGSYVPSGGSVVLLSYNMEDNKVLSGFKIQGAGSEDDDDNDEFMTFVGYIVEPILLPARRKCRALQEKIAGGRKKKEK
ncbi:hypothetical protein OROMI_010420 [Orobanche minor]